MLADAGMLSFREELHAIEAVIAGQVVAILSDAMIAGELAAGSLVKVLDVPLPGFGFYFVRAPDHRRRMNVEALHGWVRAVA